MSTVNGKGNKTPRLEDGKELWGEEIEAAFLEGHPMDEIQFSYLS